MQPTTQSPQATSSPPQAISQPPLAISQPPQPLQSSANQAFSTSMNTLPVNSMSQILPNSIPRPLITASVKQPIPIAVKAEMSTQIANWGNYTGGLNAVHDQMEEAEIEKFLQEHPPTRCDINRRDIKVAELRRIIPLLIIRSFNVRKDPTQKKSKLTGVPLFGNFFFTGNKNLANLHVGSRYNMNWNKLFSSLH